MAVIQRLRVNDWCHICGGRSDDQVAIWYPENAEHQRLDKPCRGGGVHYLRICAQCGDAISYIGKEPGGLESETLQVVVDRPGLYQKKPH